MKKIIISYIAYFLFQCFLLFSIQYMKFLEYINFKNEYINAIINPDSFIIIVYFLVITILMCKVVFKHKYNKKSFFLIREVINIFIISFLFIYILIIININDGIDINNIYFMKILLVNCLLVAVFEELFFRGYLLELAMIANKKNYKILLVITAFLFVFMHVHSLVLFNLFFITIIKKTLILFTLGIVLNYFYYNYNNLFICICIHFTYNLISNLIYKDVYLFYLMGYLLFLILIDNIIKNKKESKKNEKKRIYY